MQNDEALFTLNTPGQRNLELDFSRAPGSFRHFNFQSC